jgi:hypothetical protein
VGKEFLTHETTCVSEMLKKTTCENFCQKRPRAAWAVAGRPLPPLPLPARRVRPRHHAAIGIGGNVRHVTMPPLALAASAATSPCRHWQWRQVLKNIYFIHLLCYLLRC